MSPVLHVNTNAVNQSQRLAYWNDHIASIYGGMSVDSDAKEFNAKLIYVHIGDIGFMRAHSSHSFVQRKGDNSQTETVLLHFQNQGTSVNRQGHKEVVLKPGDFTICENRSLYTIEPNETSDVIALEIPYALAKSYIEDIEDRIIQRFSSLSLQGRVLYSILQTIQSECRTSYSDPTLSNLEPTLMASIAQLISQSTRGGRNDQHRAQHSVQKVKAIIEKNLRNSGFSTEKIAQQVGLSERRIQVLFAEMGTTPSNYIRDRRLELAAEQLRFSPAMSITQIAHDVGFSDSAYFARCFRNKFGISPKYYRAN